VEYLKKWYISKSLKHEVKNHINRVKMSNELIVSYLFLLWHHQQWMHWDTNLVW
jgi:hypothetical protein